VFLLKRLVELWRYSETGFSLRQGGLLDFSQQKATLSGKTVQLVCWLSALHNIRDGILTDTIPNVV